MSSSTSRRRFSAFPLCVALFLLTIFTTLDWECAVAQTEIREAGSWRSETLFVRISHLARFAIGHLEDRSERPGAQFVVLILVVVLVFPRGVGIAAWDIKWA